MFIVYLEAPIVGYYNQVYCNVGGSGETIKGDLAPIMLLIHLNYLDIPLHSLSFPS